MGAMGRCRGAGEILAAVVHTDGSRHRDYWCEYPASRFREGTTLPRRYHRLFWTWFAVGFPAVAAVLGILWLMTSRPMFSLF